MIRHIIMFKFTNTKNEQEKQLYAERMKNTFEPLKSKIDTIKSYETGINIKKTEFSYDFVIASSFDNWSDLESYITHPEHQSAIKACSDIEKNKAVVDYEF